MKSFVIVGLVFSKNPNVSAFISSRRTRAIWVHINKYGAQPNVCGLLVALALIFGRRLTHRLDHCVYYAVAIAFSIYIFPQVETREKGGSQKPAEVFLLLKTVTTVM